LGTSSVVIRKAIEVGKLRITRPRRYRLALADLFAYLIVLVTGRTAFRSPRSRSEHVNPWHFHQF